MKKWKKLFIIVLGTLLLACIVCLGIGANIASTPEYQATATARASAKQSTPAETVPATTFPSLPTDSPTAVATVSTPTATPDPNFDTLLTKVAGEFYATLTASVPTATPTPTQTSVAKVGDRVYFIPFSQGRPPEYEAFMPTPSPFDFILSPIRYDIAKLFSTDSVDDCNELMTREADYIDFIFNQPREVIRELVCGDQHYYLIKGTEEWDFWVPEQVVSAEMVSPIGYILGVDAYSHGIGDTLEIHYQGQPIKVLLEGVEIPERGAVFYTTFSISNNGSQPISVNPSKDMDMMNNTGVVFKRNTHTKTSWVRPLNLDDIQILPGETIRFKAGWSWSERILRKYYLTFNAPIEEGGVRITDNAVIYAFDLEVVAQKAGLFQTTPTP